MKRIVILVIVNIITLVFWAISGYKDFKRETYIPEKVLAFSRPISVKLNIGLIKSLKPAYEQ